jgi:hypothetical protein
MAIWNILWRLGIFYDHLVHFVSFGIMYQEKSGNPDLVSLFSTHIFCGAEEGQSSSRKEAAFSIRRALPSLDDCG